MNALYSVFAMKTKPDDTINRIVELEKQAKEMLDRHNDADKLATNSCDRLTALEAKVNKDHEPRIKTLEDDVKAIRDAMANIGTGTGGNIDTSAIMMKIEQVNIEVNKKIDIIHVNTSMDNQWVKIKDMVENLSIQMQKNQDAQNHAID